MISGSYKREAEHNQRLAAAEEAARQRICGELAFATGTRRCLRAQTGAAAEVAAAAVAAAKPVEKVKTVLGAVAAAARGRCTSWRPRSAPSKRNGRAAAAPGAVSKLRIRACVVEPVLARHVPRVEPAGPAGPTRDPTFLYGPRRRRGRVERRPGAHARLRARPIYFLVALEFSAGVATTAAGTAFTRADASAT